MSWVRLLMVIRRDRITVMGPALVILWVPAMIIVLCPALVTVLKTALVAVLRCALRDEACHEGWVSPIAFRTRVLPFALIIVAFPTSLVVVETISDWDFNVPSIVIVRVIALVAAAAVVVVVVVMYLTGGNLQV